MARQSRNEQARGWRQAVNKAMVLARKRHRVDELNWEQRLFSVTYVSSVRESLLSYVEAHADMLEAEWVVAILAFQASLRGEKPSPRVWYQQFFSRYPACAYVELCMGDHSLHHAARFHQARRYYRAAIDLDPQLTIAYYNLGITYQALGLFHMLQEPNQDVVKVARPDENELKARALFNMAGYLQQEGDSGEAYRLLVQALETWPEFPEANAVMQQVRTGWV